MTNFPAKIASALMESIMEAFRTEAADLGQLVEEVDAAGDDLARIRAAVERYVHTRAQAMKGINATLSAEAAEFKRHLSV